ncbi:MAG TPA: signal peptide peptidase SppA [Pseudomonadota bacterium]|nr:signal peptide peptidase SppA [Pseudomonadota bacterium]
MRHIISRVLAWVGALFLIGVLTAVLFAVFSSREKAVPAHTILELDLETELHEDTPNHPLAALRPDSGGSLRTLVTGLDRAGEDGRVVGLVARIGQGKLGLAQVQELRDAIRRFRERGKFALAYGETFGEFGPGNSSYYLATAFEQIWLQPSGDVGLTGVLMEPMFLKNALDKLGLKPQMDHRYEYKNAMNMFTENKFTAAHKEALDKIAGGWFAQMVRGIAEGRKLQETEVRALFDRGPFLGPEALKEKLVDQLGYRDEFYAKVRERGGDAQLLYLHKYVSRTDKAEKQRLKSAPTLALIYGLGGVQRGKGEVDPMSGSGALGSETVAAAFRAAVADKDVKAIVFRIDSPGGSYVASDTIWREVVRAKAAGKPVIATMGNVAGSGGYFVAMAADKIVAQPATITGSIGVLGGKFVTNELLDNRLGLTHDRVAFGQHAGMWSTNREFTPDEWVRFQAWLDRVYVDFTSKVAEGRKLPKETVLKIAKGRIWTGEDAKGVGLVDELGGLDVAVRLARQAASIADGQPVALKQFPSPKPPLQAITDALLNKDSDNSESPGAAQVGLRLRPQTLLRAAVAAFFDLELESEAPAPLSMPGVPQSP